MNNPQKIQKKTGEETLQTPKNYGRGESQNQVFKWFNYTMQPLLPRRGTNALLVLLVNIFYFFVIINQLVRLMHEGPTENRLGKLGSLYKYYYYYYY